MPELPLTISIGPLPSGQRYTPQGLVDAINARIKASTQESLALFSVGSVAPTSNQGPWLKNGVEWWVWSDTTGAYVPVQANELTLGYKAATTAPDPAKYKLWIRLADDGEPLDINYSNGSVWRDIYGAIFETLPTTDQMNAAITLANKAYPASAQLSGSQSVPIDGNLHKIDFNFAFINTESNYDTANSKYVCPMAGIYRVDANLIADNDTVSPGTPASMEISIVIAINGAVGPTTPTSGTSVASPPGDRWYPQVTGLISAGPGGSIEVYMSATDTVNTGNLIIAPQSQFFIELVQKL